MFKRVFIVFLVLFVVSCSSGDSISVVAEEDFSVTTTQEYENVEFVNSGFIEFDGDFENDVSYLILSQAELSVFHADEYEFSEEDDFDYDFENNHYIFVTRAGAGCMDSWEVSSFTSSATSLSFDLELTETECADDALPILLVLEACFQNC